MILYNIWDVGSAQAVAKAGAKALATGSHPVGDASGSTSLRAFRSPSSPDAPSSSLTSVIAPPRRRVERRAEHALRHEQLARLAVHRIGEAVTVEVDQRLPRLFLDGEVHQDHLLGGVAGAGESTIS